MVVDVAAAFTHRPSLVFVARTILELSREYHKAPFTWYNTRLSAGVEYILKDVRRASAQCFTVTELRAHMSSTYVCALAGIRRQLELLRVTPHDVASES